MSLREQNKAFNRQKILRAAEQIIRKEGIEKLSMRYLASKAGVSLRTPYNLFGSKTEVLFGLLQEPLGQILNNLSALQTDSVLLLPYAVIDQLYTPIKKDEPFFRGIYWSMMRSEHAEARDAGLQRAQLMATATLQQAVFKQELEAGTDTAAMARHLVIIGSAVIGMWAGGQISLEEARTQVGFAWANSLARYATEAGKASLLGGDLADFR